MPETDRMLRALGRVVTQSAMLEMTLRQAFCALVGSKYAAIVGAGQQTVWLIEQSRAIVEAHRELLPHERAELDVMLKACKAANEARRRLVHDVWAVGHGDTTMLIGSSYRKHEGRVTGPVTEEEVEELALDLSVCASRLSRAIGRVFGLEGATIESQLRWEEYVAALPASEVEATIRRRALASGMAADDVDALLSRWVAAGRPTSAADVRQFVAADVDAAAEPPVE